MIVIIIILIVVGAVTLARVFLSSEERESIRIQAEKDITTDLNKSNESERLSPPKVYGDYYSFNVVGMQYRPRSVKDFIDRMDGGEIVELKPDPRNQYDKNAIKVLVYDENEMTDIFIGYVPADESKEVGKLIRDNPHYSCSIESVLSDLDDDYFLISAEIKY